MRHGCLSACLFLASTVLFMLCSVADAEIREFHPVEIRLVLTKADGKETTIFHETIGADDPGLAKGIDSRVTLRPRDGDKEFETPRAGNYVQVRLSRKDKRLFLSVTATIGESQTADSDALRVTTNGLRLIEAVTVGKKIAVPLPSGRWEIAVKEEAKRQRVPIREKE